MSILETKELQCRQNVSSYATMCKERTLFQELLKFLKIEVSNITSVEIVNQLPHIC